MDYKVTITDLRDGEVVDEYVMRFETKSQAELHVETLRIILTDHKVRASAIVA